MPRVFVSAADALQPRELAVQKDWGLLRSLRPSRFCSLPSHAPSAGVNPRLAVYGTKCENIPDNHRGASMSDSEATEVGQKFIEQEEVEKKLAAVTQRFRDYAAVFERAALVFGGLGGKWEARRERLILKGHPRDERSHLQQRNPNALGFDISTTQDLEFPSREDVIKALEEQNDLLAKKRELDRFFASRKR